MSCSSWTRTSTRTRSALCDNGSALAPASPGWWGNRYSRRSSFRSQKEVLEHNQLGNRRDGATQPSCLGAGAGLDGGPGGSSRVGRSQEELWRQFFRNPALWWDSRQRKKGLLSPDFRHRQSQEVLWLNNLYKPAWVDAQLAALDGGMVLGHFASRSRSQEVENPDTRGPAVDDSPGVTAETVNRLCRDGHLAEAVEALEVLVRTDRGVSGSLFYTVLKQCMGNKDLRLGTRVHGLMVKKGYQSDTFLGFHILRMYASHGRLQEAMDVFEAVAKPHAFTWSAIISAHVKQGQNKQAIQLYLRMRRSGVKPDGHVFVAALQACARGLDLNSGQQVHADVLTSGAEPNLFVSSCLVDMYAKCGSLYDARRVFDGLGKKNVVVWNAMIGGYSQQGMGQEALFLYNAMLEEGMAVPDAATFVCLLQACASVGALALEEGKQLHRHIRERGHEADEFVANSLVNMYAKCGSLEDAHQVFDGLGQKDVVTWNVMIAGYSQQGFGQEALRMYGAMQEQAMALPDPVTFVCLLQACTSVGTPALGMGKQIHMQIRERGLDADVLVANSLVSMYAKCGRLEDAHRVFDGLGQRNLVTWNAMIAGYSQQGMGQEALSLYSAMLEEGMAVPDSVTFVCLLQACASLGSPALEMGMQVHMQISQEGHEGDVFVASSLIHMYAKCGSLKDARRVFEGLGQKNLVTWTTMIAGYSQQGMGQEALHLYSVMQEEGIVSVEPVTFVCLLQACASMGTLALEKGKELHMQIKEQGYEGDVFVSSSLVNMYAKCGSLDDAQRVFDGLGQKNVVTWTAMIAGYSQQGLGHEALRLYSAMQEEGMAVTEPMTFVSLLQACACVGTVVLEKGKELHMQIRKQGHEANLFVASSLVTMYAKCGSLHDAHRVFDGLVEKNVVTWTAIIAGYSQKGMGQEAIHLYRAMQEERKAVAEPVTFVCLLQACAVVGPAALETGIQLHSHIKEGGHEADISIASSLVNMYAKCGSLKDAQSVFHRLCQKNVGTWNAMIAGYSQQGMGREALHLYRAMQEEGMAAPDFVTFVCLLQACAREGAAALEMGKELHMQIQELGQEADVFVASSLVNMYAKCGSLEDARRVFDGLGQKNVVTWNAMIAGYSQQGMGQEALRLYTVMQEHDSALPDPVTFVSLLQACATVGAPALEMGKQLHGQIRDQRCDGDMFIASSLVNMYAKCGSVEDAEGVFENFGQNDKVTLNAMLAGYSHHGMGQEALHLFSAVQKKGIAVPDSMTFSCLLRACASVGPPALEKGKQLHAQIRESGYQADDFIASSLVNMYAKCGSLEDAHRVFDKLVDKDVVTWNAMFAGYSQQGMGQEAFHLYSAMQEDTMAVPDAVTFVCLLQACASVGSPALEKGRQLHAQIRQQGQEGEVFIASSLVNMYAKCGSLEDAQRVFGGLGEKNVVTWNAMIAGYSQQSMGQEALRLFSVMQGESSVVPNSITFVCLLQACANVAAVHLGRQLHSQIEQQGLQADTSVAASLINMYGKSGSMVDAQQVFDALPRRDVVAWNALIAGYSCQGDSERVFNLVQEMAEDGVQPVGITFVCVITVCSHVGLVTEGRHYFEVMRTRYGISPTVEHCTCMVDLLCRAGQLDEALSFIRTMPVQPSADVWHTLLGACQKWSNVEVGLHAFNEAVKLNNEDAAPYVLMSNIYTGAQMWEQAQEMQGRRKSIRAWKQPGQSWWTDMDGLVHSFLVGEKKLSIVAARTFQAGEGSSGL